MPSPLGGSSVFVHTPDWLAADGEDETNISSFPRIFMARVVRRVIVSQPRIVCHDPQRETRGWAGPGAYEWDDRPDDDDDDPNDRDNHNSNRYGDNNNINTDDDDDGGAFDAGQPRAGSEAAAGGGGDQRNDRRAAVSRKHEKKPARRDAGGGRRPRGISVRDPFRLSPVFQEGSSGFVVPAQTNVRGFALAPFSRNASTAAVVEAAGVFCEDAGESWGRGGRAGAPTGSVVFDKSHGGVRRRVKQTVRRLGVGVGVGSPQARNRNQGHAFESEGASSFFRLRPVCL